jgi:hypothetical protein
MNRRSKFLFLLIAFIFLVAALSGFDRVTAQEAGSKKDVKPTPTPTISEEDEVVKVETDAVNVLFTAQDKNRRLLTQS